MSHLIPTSGIIRYQGQEKYPIFLFDKDASPVIVVEKMISLPLKFYALADDEQLTAHVKKLSEAEHEHHL